MGYCFVFMQQLSSSSQALQFGSASSVDEAFCSKDSSREELEIVKHYPKWDKPPRDSDEYV